ncbi:glycine-rich domain-containing protein [Streptosporangium sp. NPDC004631]
MTATTEFPTRGDLVHPRTLIDTGLFDRLVLRVVHDHHIGVEEAEQIMEQTLAFLLACALRPWMRLAPSPQVDLGWHAFIVYTREYALFCTRVAGRFIHHTPDDETTEPARPADDTAAVDQTTTVMRELGLPVAKALWPRPADCTSKCHQCHAGCYNSPEKR